MLKQLCDCYRINVWQNNSFYAKTVQLNLSFLTSFGKPINSLLLALDSLILSLNDCQQVALIAFREFFTHYQVVGINPIYRVNDLHDNIVTRSISPRYDVFDRCPWHTDFLSKCSDGVTLFSMMLFTRSLIVSAVVSVLIISYFQTKC